MYNIFCKSKKLDEITKFFHSDFQLFSSKFYKFLQIEYESKKGVQFR